MPDQAPNIDIKRGGGSRLVYDKARRTIIAAPNERQKANQELFERLRLLVIKHGTQEDVDALHEMRERFNHLATTYCPRAAWCAPVVDDTATVTNGERK